MSMPRTMKTVTPAEYAMNTDPMRALPAYARTQSENYLCCPISDDPSNYNKDGSLTNFNKSRVIGRQKAYSESDITLQNYTMLNQWSAPRFARAIIEKGNPKQDITLACLAACLETLDKNNTVDTEAAFRICNDLLPVARRYWKKTGKLFRVPSEITHDEWDNLIGRLILCEYLFNDHPECGRMTVRPGLAHATSTSLLKLRVSGYAFKTLRECEKDMHERTETLATGEIREAIKRHKLYTKLTRHKAVLDYLIIFGVSNALCGNVFLELLCHMDVRTNESTLRPVDIAKMLHITVMHAYRCFARLAECGLIGIMKTDSTNPNSKIKRIWHSVINPSIAVSGRLNWGGYLFKRIIAAFGVTSLEDPKIDMWGIFARKAKKLCKSPLPALAA